MPQAQEEKADGQKAAAAAEGIHELLNALKLNSTEKYAALIQAMTIWLAFSSLDYDDFLRNCTTSGKLLQEYASKNRKAYENVIATRTPANG